MRKKRLGEVLRERGVISADKLDQILQEQQGKVVMLGELLLERGLISKNDLVASLEDVVRVPYVDCEHVEVEPEALELLPRAAANRLCVFPLTVDGTRMVVAMVEPQNLRTLDELRFVTGKEVSPRLSFRKEITAAIERHYASEQDAQPKDDKRVGVEVAESVEMEFETLSSRHSHERAMREIQEEIRQKRTPAVRLVSHIIAAAANKRASDIHIEPQAGGGVVRIRVDGVLRELMQIPARLQNPVTSRVKILADMDIAERRAPQDGRFLVSMASKKLDLRVSTLPTHYGEKVVMRLLDPNAPSVRFEELGMSSDKVAALERVLSLPQGMLLVTGPTGSGKSTTLYTSLTRIHKPQVNIVTVEDPIEYMLPGINQVQVHVKAGLTFAKCLRSLLRQDPNVIMVGEVRDKETAEIALKAAQTGHLVLSTLHTNDSIAAVTRLIDLGIEPFLIATSVSAVMAQRLVRKLCICHRVAPMTLEHAARLEEIGLRDYDDRVPVAVGCEQCDQTGYRGRVGIYEIVSLDQDMRSLIRSGVRNEEIRALARAKGVTFMQDDAVEKIRAGLTTLEEVLRVIPFEHSDSLRCQGCGRELAAVFCYCPFCGTRKESEPAMRDGAVPIHATPGGR